MTVLTILFYTFIVVVCIQLVYYLVIFKLFAFSKVDQPSKKNIGISVLICAKNEAENLKQFVPQIIQQDFEKFEIVLINDASSDDTLDVMKGFEAKHENIKVVDVLPNDTFWGSKKYALTLGIKASTHDYLLFTDADCKPLTNQWIKTMSSHFSNAKSIVIGYSGYKKVKGSLLNKLIRFETVLTAIQYFSYAKIGKPYMAVGRNLAYRKEEFFRVNGFTSHMKLHSGDDDLFINQVATPTNTAICINQGGFTQSLPKTSYKNWIRQKQRHVSTAKYYKPKNKFLLGLFYISQLLFWILAISLSITTFKWPFVLGLIAIRFLSVYLIFWHSARKLNEKDLLLGLPLLELFLITSQLVIFISNLTTRSKRWK